MFWLSALMFHCFWSNIVLPHSCCQPFHLIDLKINLYHYILLIFIDTSTLIIYLFLLTAKFIYRLGNFQRQGTLPGNQLTGNRFSSYKHIYLWFRKQYNKIIYHAVFLNVLATFLSNFCKKIILFIILTRDWKKLGIKNYLF